MAEDAPRILTQEETVDHAVAALRNKLAQTITDTGDLGTAVMIARSDFKMALYQGMENQYGMYLPRADAERIMFAIHDANARNIEEHDSRATANDPTGLPLIDGKPASQAVRAVIRKVPASGREEPVSPTAAAHPEDAVAAILAEHVAKPPAAPIHEDPAAAILQEAGLPLDTNPSAVARVTGKRDLPPMPRGR